MQIITFGAEDIANSIAGLSPRDLDGLPFGVVQLDSTGRIILYNKAEGKLARFDPESAIGKNFFTEVAPCTNVVGFRDQFDQGVRSGQLNVVLEWQFTGENMPLVQVHMKKAKVDNRFWLFIKRL
jgi:photoactive yellow protein